MTQYVLLMKSMTPSGEWVDFQTFPTKKEAWEFLDARKKATKAYSQIPVIVGPILMSAVIYPVEAIAIYP